MCSFQQEMGEKFGSKTGQFVQNSICRAHVFPVNTVTFFNMKSQLRKRLGFWASPGLALIRLGTASLSEIQPRALFTEQSSCLASSWPMSPSLLLVLYSNIWTVLLYFLENAVYIFASCSTGGFLFGVPSLFLNFLITLNLFILVTLSLFIL